MNEELNVQNAELEDTTPQENQEQPQDNSEENTPDTTPEGQEGTEEESARSGNDGSNIAAEPEPEAFLPVRYNHSDINLTREEAKNWAQKGMFYFDKLDFVAAQSDQTVEELLETLLTSIDENNHLLDALRYAFFDLRYFKPRDPKEKRRRDTSANYNLRAEDFSGGWGG